MGDQPVVEWGLGLSLRRLGADLCSVVRGGPRRVQDLNLGLPVNSAGHQT